MSAAKRKRLSRIQQVLYHVEHDDDVYFSDFPQSLLIRLSLEDTQPGATGVIGCLRGQFEPNDVEMPASFHQP